MSDGGEVNSLNLTFFNAKSTSFPPIHLNYQWFFNNFDTYTHTDEIRSLIFHTWTVQFSSEEASSSFSGPQLTSVTLLRCPACMNFFNGGVPLFRCLICLWCWERVFRRPRRLLFYLMTLKQTKDYLWGSKPQCSLSRYAPRNCEAASIFLYFFVEVSDIPEVDVTVFSSRQQ